MTTLSLLNMVRSRWPRVMVRLSLMLAAPCLLMSAMGQGVDLGTAEGFAVLAGAGITNTGTTTIFGNVGTFPTPSITGFNTVTLDGVIHGDNAVTQQAKFDLLTAYNDAAGRPAPPANTYSPIFDLGGLTLIPGVYNDPTSFEITGVLTLDGQGNSDSVWIFQTGSTLLTASNSTISLINGADACNIFWQVGSSATLGTGTDFAGTIMALTDITLNTGATVDGKVLALNGAVTLDGNTVMVPICDMVFGGTTTITVPSNTLIVVTGTALLDGTLEVLTLVGNDLEFGDQYAFLQAGDIEGTFVEILMPTPDVRGRFVNNGQTGSLLVAPASYTQVAVTPNQVRVAQALDEWIGIEDGDIGDVTLALDLLNGDGYAAAFEAIMPGFYGEVLNTGIELSHNQGQLLFQQLGSRRLGSRQEVSQPIIDEWSGKQVVEPGYARSSGLAGGKDVVGLTPGKSIATEGYPNEWNTWVMGSGLFSDDSLGLMRGGDFESGTFMVGADRAVTEHLTLGLFTSYQEGRGDYDNGGSIDLESTRVGGYAALDFDAFYVNGAAGVGTTNYQMRRPIQVGTIDRTALSDTDGSEYFAMLGTGYDFHFGNFTFGPVLSAQYTHLNVDGFTERGADSLNLRVNNFEGESLRSYLGGHIAFTHRVNPEFTVIPELRAFWQHEHLDQEAGISAALDGGSGPGFNYFTEGPDNDGVYAGAGVSMLIDDDLTLSTFYNADFGRNNGTQHTVTIGASWRF